MPSKKSIDINGSTILVTGSPGFIGANLVLRLLKTLSSGIVISFDNMSKYYDPALKEYRLREIEETIINTSSDLRHVFIKGNIADKELVNNVFADYQPDIVVNLAAQAGVRNSIDLPDAYIESNIIGFYNILEACRNSYILPVSGKTDQRGRDVKLTRHYYGVRHLIFASSSSVYGNNSAIPFSTENKADEPVSLYAATKKSDELLAHAYAKLYNIPCTGLRFFTVYGPAGRPDMFYYSATQKLLRGDDIKIFNYGNCRRDFTYIDDIVEGIVRVMQGAPVKENGEDGLPVPPYALYNIGNGKPVNLSEFVQILQEELVSVGLLRENYDFAAHRVLLPMQAGDVAVTYADTKPLERDFGYRPQTDIRTGLRAFVKWYRDYSRNGEWR